MAATGQLHIWAILGVFRLVGMLLCTASMPHADPLTERVESSDNTVRVPARELTKLLSQDDA